MSLSVLDVSQIIPNVGKKEEGSDGTRFQLYPSRGFPSAMETQKGPLNPFVQLQEQGRHRARTSGLTLFLWISFSYFISSNAGQTISN